MGPTSPGPKSWRVGRAGRSVGQVPRSGGRVGRLGRRVGRAGGRLGWAGRPGRTCEVSEATKLFDLNSGFHFGQGLIWNCGPLLSRTHVELHQPLLVPGSSLQCRRSGPSSFPICEKLRNEHDSKLTLCTWLPSSCSFSFDHMHLYLLM